MGCGKFYRCTECGYVYYASFGIGMMFPVTYAETITAMKNGKFGEEARTFAEEHPEGAVNCASVVKRCEDCGALWNAQDLGMYLPKAPEIYEKLTGGKSRFSAIYHGEKVEYVSPEDLEPLYDLYCRHDDVCEKCRSRNIRIYTESEFSNAVVDGRIRCPECGGALKEPDSFLMWD